MQIARMTQEQYATALVHAQLWEAEHRIEELERDLKLAKGSIGICIGMDAEAKLGTEAIESPREGNSWSLRPESADNSLKMKTATKKLGGDVEV